MIIRILNDNQYNVPSLYLDQINLMDNEIVRCLARDDRNGFREYYRKMIDLIKKNGVPVDEHLLKQSDLIVPPPDLNFDEAKNIFTGEGIIPG